jgi:hypothetical protein
VQLSKWWVKVMARSGMTLDPKKTATNRLKMSCENVLLDGDKKENSTKGEV